MSFSTNMMIELSFNDHMRCAHMSSFMSSKVVPDGSLPGSANDLIYCNSKLT